MNIMKKYEVIGHCKNTNIILMYICKYSVGEKSASYPAAIFVLPL